MRKPSPSSLEFALLGALAQQPRSGYDLRKMLAETPMRHYSDSPGSIYPALQRLKRRKWTTVASDKGNARGREVFHITPAGQDAFLAWLQEPFKRTDVMRHLDVLLLRFAFFDGNLSRKKTLAFLAQLERQIEDCIADLDAYAQASGIAQSLNTGALAFAYGLDSYRGLLVWARQAHSRLAKDMK